MSTATYKALALQISTAAVNQYKQTADAKTACWNRLEKSMLK